MKSAGDEDSKSTTCSGYLPSLGTDFTLILDPDLRLPVMEGKEKLEAIRLLGETLKLTDYETNLISFWILETLSAVIKECQIAHMVLQNQKMTILWIIYVLKTIIYYGFKRRTMFKHLEELFIRAHPIVCTGAPIPSPYSVPKETIQTESTHSMEFTKSKSHSFVTGSEMEIKKDGKDDKRTSETKSSKLSYRRSGAKSYKGRKYKPIIAGRKKSLVQEKDADFLLLIDILYKIFGCRFKYEVIFQAFSDPIYVQTVPISKGLLKPKKSVSKPYSTARGTVFKKSTTKSKLVQPEKKKADRKRSAKDDFLQKLMKIVMDSPVQKKEEKIPELMSLPYLLPLNDAVDASFFKAGQWYQLGSKRALATMSLDKARPSRYRTP